MCENSDLVQTIAIEMENCKLNTMTLISENVLKVVTFIVKSNSGEASINGIYLCTLSVNRMTNDGIVGKRIYAVQDCIFGYC